MAFSVLPFSLLCAAAGIAASTVNANAATEVLRLVITSRESGTAPLRAPPAYLAPRRADVRRAAALYVKQGSGAIVAARAWCGLFLRVRRLLRRACAWSSISSRRRTAESGP